MTNTRSCSSSGSARLQALPVVPANEFQNGPEAWHEVDASTKSAAPDDPSIPISSFTDEREYRFCKAVIDNPLRPSSQYPKLVRVSTRTAGLLRKALVSKNWIREQSVESSGPGRPTILLEATAAGMEAVAKHKGEGGRELMASGVLILIALSILLPGLTMRGGAFHNLLVDQVSSELEAAGFKTQAEHPVRRRFGRLDFVDILAIRASLSLIVEVETTARNALTNILTGLEFGWPIWVIVPTRRVRAAVVRQVDRHLAAADRRLIWILLPDEVVQTLTDCFPGFSGGEYPEEKQKNNDSAGRHTRG